MIIIFLQTFNYFFLMFVNAIISFYFLLAIAVASGPFIYIYKNLRPYFKFSLPLGEVSLLERYCIAYKQIIIYMLLVLTIQIFIIICRVCMIWVELGKIFSFYKSRDSGNHVSSNIVSSISIESCLRCSTFIFCLSL